MKRNKREFEQFTKEILAMPESKFLEGLLAIISTYYPEQDMSHLSHQALPEDMQIPENIIMCGMLIHQRIKEILEQNET